MKCPVCKSSDLIEVMATNGVLVDYCPKCEGFWLDKGEIYYFAGKSALLYQELNRALKNSKPSNRKNPKTNTQLIELSLFQN